MIKLILPLLLLTVLTQNALSKRINLVQLGRNFVLVSPEIKPTAPRPLLVLLHGCIQDPSLILEGTQLEVAALKNNFYILVPEQSKFSNIDRCWNWFMGFEQMRNPGTEMGQIISGVEMATVSYPIDKSKIYVAGISAGGAMAHNLTACYPDVFTGSAVHSGVTFKAAETIYEARPVLTAHDQKSPEYLGKRMLECSAYVQKKKLKKVLIIHGDQDRSVSSFHADLITKSQAVWRDYLDDGSRNDSARGTVSTQNIKFTNGYEVEKTDTQYQNFLERKLIVKGLPHAWGGGKPVSVHFEPKAPSSTEFILDFFGL